MLLTVRSAAVYELSADAYMCLMVEPPRVGSSHRVEAERLFTSPTSFCELSRDLYGNPLRRLVAAKGTFNFEFTATIEAALNEHVASDATEQSPQQLPSEVMIYTLPSRYCQSDLLARMAQLEFGHVPRGAARVHAVAKWVRQHVEYRYGTTDSKTSAFDTATERIGVCRDFAHLVIAFCRGLDIPARYVSGYALCLEPPDFHGYAQVYLGGTWHNVDATSESPRPALVPIAVGRDAADIPVTTLWGPHTLIEQTVLVREVAPVSSAGDA
jgi:transglutaminase-like putative cysteine protease